NFLLGDAEPNPVLDTGDGADRDGHLLAAPQVAFLEKHVSHVVVASVDDQPFDVPDLPVGGVNTLATADGHLAQGDGVVGGGLREPGDRIAFHARATTQA